MWRFIIFIFILTVYNLPAQKIKVKTLAILPKLLHERSGLVIGINNTVWTHNDSGGEPILYKVNTKAEIERKIRVLNVKNVDWEDMANDFSGHVYIADIGNNRNLRKDLQIIKIPHPDSLRTDSVVPEIISFKYENQKDFPPIEAELNFDAESLIAFEDSLYIFTKNQTKPYSKYTYVYVLCNREGMHIAKMRDSIYLPRTRKLHSWVTGAARHPDKDFVVLLSHKKAWILKNFRNKVSQQLIKTRVSGCYSQKEAIGFDANGGLWLASETLKFLKAKLMKGSVIKKRLTFEPYKNQH